MCRVKRILLCMVCLVCLLLPVDSFPQVKSELLRATQSQRGGKTMNQSKPLTQVENPMVPVPIPQQVSAKEGMAELPGTRLGYWDTGGSGTAVVLLHPASGSALVWLYQQPVFANAGYRVIAYSRRNYYNSELAPEDNPGVASEDLHNLMEFLGVT